MKKYIKYLIEDLEEVKLRSMQKLSNVFNGSESSDFDLYHSDDHSGIKIGDLIGMEQFFFPKVDYLTDGEAEKVVEIFVGVYNAYGLNPIFENCVSDRIKYGHLRHSLNHQVFPVSNQVVDVEMCDYLPQYCPLYELCSAHNSHRVCCELKKRA